MPAIPMISQLADSASATGFTLNAATSEVACMYVASKSGTIDRVRLWAAASTSPPVYEVRIETVATAVPSGTLLSTNTNATFTPTVGSNVVTLTSSASVVRGELYAIRLKYSSGTIGASNSANFNRSGSARVSFGGSCELNGSLTSSNNGSTWGTPFQHPQFCAIYSDDTLDSSAVALNYSTMNQAIGTANVTDIGVRFTSPMTASLVGAIVTQNYLPGSSQAPFNLRLLSTGDSVLATQAVAAAKNSFNYSILYFGTPYTVSAGTDYRLAMQSTVSTTQFISLYQMYSVAANQACHGNLYASDKTGGTWTDRTQYAPGMIPLFESPSSGGGIITQRGGFTGGFSG